MAQLGDRDRARPACATPCHPVSCGDGWKYHTSFPVSGFNATIEHVSTRHAYGGPLAEQQSVAHKLAELATQLQAARLLVYAAARTYDSGASRGEITRSAAMAKLFATEVAQTIVDQCVQLHGARALERGHLLEHLYRDVRAPRIYEGASEVQRTIIARELFRERNTR